MTKHEPMETRQFRLPTALTRGLEEWASRDHSTVANLVRRVLVDALRAAGIEPLAPATPKLPVPVAPAPPATVAPSQAPTPIRRPKAPQPAPVAPEPQPYDPAHPKPTLRPGTPGVKP